MEESDLLKERLHAITEKHRVQEGIRQKKLELDREKLKLKHLKKMALKEQWLLEDSTSHNALQQQQSLLADQQQARRLQSDIHRIEKEVESLEREESRISTNESFILKRLKAVEKSSEDVIKEVQENFVPEPIQVTTVIPDYPKSFTSPADSHSELELPKQTLIAMEINIVKNVLTGERKVVSTATVTPQDLRHRGGVKVYDDGRKCVYALETPQGSHDQGGVAELSPSEVEQLLRDATQHRHGNHQNPNRREGCRYGDYQEQGTGGEGHCHGNHKQKKRGNSSDQTNHHGNQELHYNIDKEINYHNNHGVRHHHGNYQEGYHQERKCYSNQGKRYYHGNHQASDIIRGSSRRSQGSRANGCPPPRSHDQEVTSAYCPELCYTPANHIPLSDYISVEEEELYLYSPPPYYSYSQTEHSHQGDSQSESKALFYDRAQSDRGPSPLYGADAPYTILSAMETTEPITAVFLGFQTTQDDNGRGQEYEGSVKAELVVITDDDNDDDVRRMKEEKSPTHFGNHGYPAGRSANGNTRQMDAVRGRMDRRPGAGIRKIKKHKHCCSVC